MHTLPVLPKVLCSLIAFFDFNLMATLLHFRFPVQFPAGLGKHSEFLWLSVPWPCWCALTTSCVLRHFHTHGRHHWLKSFTSFPRFTPVIGTVLLLKVLLFIKCLFVMQTCLDPAWVFVWCRCQSCQPQKMSFPLRILPRIVPWLNL